MYKELKHRFNQSTVVTYLLSMQKHGLIFYAIQMYSQKKAEISFHKLLLKITPTLIKQVKWNSLNFVKKI